MDNARWVVLDAPHTVDIADENEFFSAECFRDGHRRCVGVDVVFLPRIIDAHGWDDRDLAGVGQAFDGLAVDAGDLSDEPEIDGIRTGFFQEEFLSEENVCGTKVQIHRTAAEPFDFVSQERVEFVAEGLFDDRECLCIGDATTFDPHRFDRCRFHGFIDRRSATVDNDRSHPYGFHKNDIDQCMTHRIGVAHERTT